MTTYTSQLQVRVIAQGGKFLGDDISGATITVRHAQTGELLASGTLSGGSGDLWALMINPMPRTEPLPTAGASVFTATISSSSQAPIPLLITAIGPGAGLQSATTVSATQWIVPGLTDLNGNKVVFSCLLELPGLIVQVMNPPTHLNVPSLPQTVNFEVNVAMMCGCPIDNNMDTDGPHTFPNPWPTKDFVAGCIVSCAGQTVDQLELSFDAAANIPGRYIGTWQMKSPGFYSGYVYAHQISTGNIGTGTVSFFALG